MDGWLKLAQWITAQLGLPGALIAAAGIYLAYLLKTERDAHEATRKQVNEANEKRLEILSSQVKTMGDVTRSIEALGALILKVK